MLRSLARGLHGTTGSPGPLAGVRVLELEGLAASPLCGHLLRAFGADVVRVDQAGRTPHVGTSALDVGKRSVALDLKAPAGKEARKPSGVSILGPSVPPSLLPHPALLLAHPEVRRS